MSARRWAAELRYSARHPWARSGLWAVTAAAVLVLAAAGAWWPAQREHAALDEAIAAKRRGVIQARQSEELARAYAQARGAVEVLEKKLQHGATQAQLVENFARLARKHGVRIVAETYDEGRGAAGAQPALSAELTVQGSYPALREFLRELSALPTWSEVHEVRLETVQGTATQKGRIRIVTYRRSAPGEARTS